MLNAANSGDVRSIQSLVRARCVDIDYRYDQFRELESESKSLLFFAILEGDYELAQTLLKLGANPNTAIHQICHQDKTGELLKFMITECGADVQLILPDGTTPLHVAAEIGNIEVVKILLEANADASAANNDRYLPVGLAAMNDHHEIVDLLLAEDDN